MSRMNGKFAKLVKASSVDCSLLVAGDLQQAVTPPETAAIAVNGGIVETVAVNNRKPPWYDETTPQTEVIHSDVSDKIGRRSAGNRIAQSVVNVGLPVSIRQLWTKSGAKKSQ